MAWRPTSISEIQKERPAGGGLKEADLPASLGAGEGPLGIAEELGLQHIGVEVGAVDGHEHPGGAGAGVVDGLGVQLLSRAALRLEQDGDVGLGQAAGQLPAGRRPGGDRHNGVKGVVGGVGLVDSAEHLTAALFIALQLRPEVEGVLPKGNHRQAAHHLRSVEDGVHVDEVDVLALLARGVQDGALLSQHLRQPGTGAQQPQGVSLDRPDGPAGLLLQKGHIGPVSIDNALLRVNDQHALLHGVQDCAGDGIKLHGGRLLPFCLYCSREASG